MISISYGLTALLLGLSLLAGSATAGSQPAAQKTAFSARDYCRSSGGAVSETRQAHIYLCCYPGKSQCTASDTQQTISWRVSASAAKTHWRNAQ